MEKKYPYFYKRHKLKHVTSFLSPENHLRLKQLAQDDDKSLTRYVTRLLERHITQVWQQRSEDLPRHSKRHSQN